MLPEKDVQFVAACVRCGECMKVCPTNTLQPAVGEGGLERSEHP
jgi:ferredoxin